MKGDEDTKETKIGKRRKGDRAIGVTGIVKKRSQMKKKVLKKKNMESEEKNR